MRKMLAMILAGGLLLATFPGRALAGDNHAVRTGIALGAAAAVVGGVLLSAWQRPALAPVLPAVPPPATYSAVPPVLYTPGPAVVYAPPPAVVYPAPVVAYPAPATYAPARPAHRGWAHSSHRDRDRHEHGTGWDRH